MDTGSCKTLHEIAEAWLRKVSGGANFNSPNFSSPNNVALSGNASMNMNGAYSYSVGINVMVPQPNNPAISIGGNIGGNNVQPINHLNIEAVITF